MDSNHFVIAQTRGLECKNGLGLHDFQQLTTKLPRTQLNILLERVGATQLSMFYRDKGFVYEGKYTAAIQKATAECLCIV